MCMSIEHTASGPMKYLNSETLNSDTDSWMFVNHSVNWSLKKCR